MKLSHALCPWLIVGLLHAEPTWKPHYDDAALSPAEEAEIAAAVPTQAIATPTAGRRLLVVSATQGFRHKSIPFGKHALTLMGESTGAYATVVSDDPANFAPEVLASFDAVVLLSPTRDFFMPKPSQQASFTAEEWASLEKRQERLVDNLVAYVEGGGGLVGIHSATDACYGHAEFGETIGAFFDGHPWQANNRVTIVVEDPDHALIAPVFGERADFELVEEIYQFKEVPYSRERLRILLRLDPARSDPVGGMKRADGDYAVSWVQAAGKGRVFYTSIGHNNFHFSNPLLLKHYLAGIQFAVGDLAAVTTPSALREDPSEPRIEEGNHPRELFE